MQNLFSGNSYIAIGAYKQSLSRSKYAMGAFTYSEPLAISKPPVKIIRMLGRRRIRVPFGSPTALFGFSINVNDLDQSSIPRVASVAFHELLHNVGLGHGNNDPDTYKNRKLPILALEDCMYTQAEKLQG
jgi:hypothetical protein